MYITKKMDIDSIFFTFARENSVYASDCEKSVICVCLTQNM